jgi:hypothetical protein
MGIVLFYAVTLSGDTADVDGLMALVLIECNFMLLNEQRISCLAEAA